MKHDETHENEVDTQLLELKEITGTFTNVELAMALGTTKSTIQTWRHRGKIPDKVFQKARRISQNETSGSTEFLSLSYQNVGIADGKLTLTDTKIKPAINFSAAFLRDELGATRDSIFCMRVRGDAMHPTLKDGATMLVRKQSEFADDGIYLLRVNDQVLIKRLQFSQHGMSVISDNPRYKPWELSNEELASSDIEAVGQVVWIGGKL